MTDPVIEPVSPDSETGSQTTAEAPPESVNVKAGKSKKSGTAAKERKPRSLAWMGYVLLLGTVIMVAGGWLLLQELRSRQEGLGGQLTDKGQQVQEVSHQMTSVQTEIASLHTQIATLQSGDATDDAKIERMLSEHADKIDQKLAATRSDLTQSVQTIQRQLNRSRGDLLVTDAEYLLGVANQKLTLVGDVKSVLAAMEAADQRLRESGDPSVFKVREVLADEMAQLKKVEGLDIVGISADLIALENKVATLPTSLPHAGTLKEQEAQKASEKAHSEPANPDEDAFDQAIQNIKDLVTVRRIERKVEAVLTPEQVQLIQQILILKLEAARSALIRNNETLFRNSLEDVGHWLEEHFDLADDRIKRVQEDLLKLKERSLDVAYPDISKSLVMLQNIERIRVEAEEEALRRATDTSVSKPMEPASATPPASIPQDSSQSPREKSGNVTAPAVPTQGEGKPPSEPVSGPGQSSSSPSEKSKVQSPGGGERL